MRDRPTGEDLLGIVARIEDGDLLLIDTGAEAGYYSADVTRTFPANGRFTKAQREVYAVVLAAHDAAIAAIALAYLAALAPVTGFLITLPLAAKLPLALAAIAPLAFCMGMPFPLGLARVSREVPALVPWAWGINGCASVVSAVLATLLAIEFGFTAVVALAVALYLLAALVWRGRL